MATKKAKKKAKEVTDLELKREHENLKREHEQLKKKFAALEKLSASRWALLDACCYKLKSLIGGLENNHEAIRSDMRLPGCLGESVIMPDHRIVSGKMLSHLVTGIELDRDRITEAKALIKKIGASLDERV